VSSGLPQEREADAEHDPQDEPEDAVARRLRLHLHDLLGALDDRRVRGLQRLHRGKRLLALDEALVQRGVPVARLDELPDPRVDARERARDRRRVELAPVDGVGRRVRVDEQPRESRIVVGHGEGEDVGVRRRRHARSEQQLLRRQARAGDAIQHALRELRHPRDVGLRLRNPVRLQVDAGRLRPRELSREVLRAEQHLRLGLVQLLLVEGEEHGRERHEHDGLQDDPFPPPDDVQVIPQRRRMRTVSIGCHPPSPFPAAVRCCGGHIVLLIRVTRNRSVVLPRSGDERLLATSAHELDGE